MIEVLQKILREVFEMALKELYTPSNYGTMDGDIALPVKESIRLSLYTRVRSVYGVGAELRDTTDEINEHCILEAMPVNKFKAWDSKFTFPDYLNGAPDKAMVQSAEVPRQYMPFLAKSKKYYTNVRLPCSLIDSASEVKEAKVHLPEVDLRAVLQDSDTGEIYASTDWEAFTLPKYATATHAWSLENFAECYMGYSPDMVVSFPRAGDYEFRFFVPFGFFCDNKLSSGSPRARVVLLKPYYSYPSSGNVYISVWCAPA